MLNNDFQTFLEAEFKRIIEIRNNAHQEYAGVDVFDNFNRRARELGITRKQAWAVLAFKHNDTIRKYCAGEDGVENREAIENRIRDEILYLFLLLGMVVEDKTINVSTRLENIKNPHESPYGTINLNKR